MWDISNILACPYCKCCFRFDCPRLECVECGRIYHVRDGMYYMYDVSMPHWAMCQDQIKALFRLDYQDDWKPRHDNLKYPYMNLDVAGIGQRANAAMFNVAKELIGARMFSEGYALDVGAYNGWSSFRLAEHKMTVALDSSDHPCYGVGSVPSVGRGVEKVIGDGCFLPLADNSFDIVFMASALHHMHDKVQAMNEAYRVLSDGGIFVAIGDKMMDDSQIEIIAQDGIRDYEGMPYTETTLQRWFAESDFTELKLLPLKYQDGMEYMGMNELVAEQGDNAVIFGVK